MEYVLLEVKDMPPAIAKELREIEGVHYINPVRRCVGVEEPDVSTDTRPLGEVIRFFQRNGILLVSKSTHPTLGALIGAVEKNENPITRFVRTSLARVVA